MKAMQWMAAAFSVCALLGVAGLYYAGTVASAPAPIAVGAPPADLAIEPVGFDSASGSRIAGWFIPGEAHRGGIILMHGVRANRLEMLGRARMLHAHGFAVLLFDFQAHGESTGRHITFGYLESLDAKAALNFMRQRLPGERIGADGMSLGGAAAVLGGRPMAADAMVLEAVYGTFADALRNRLVLHYGSLGHLLFPLLSWQVKPRLGFALQELEPERAVAEVHVPMLVIAGEQDRHAALTEAEEIFGRANEPKELWVVTGAGHQDFHRFAPEEYERRVVAFFARYLAS